MAAPMAQQQQPAQQVKQAAVARKRRRRATAGGASDDCFTCVKRNVKCDRRRPYCSQCLEVGNECSGYKTQLTWGVGVASRGKLRGLSLPVAKSAPAVRDTTSASSSTAASKKATPRSARARSNSSNLSNNVSPVSPMSTMSNMSNMSGLSAQIQSHRMAQQQPLPTLQTQHVHHHHHTGYGHVHSSPIHHHASAGSLPWPDCDDVVTSAHSSVARSPIDIPISSAASAPVTPYGAMPSTASSAGYDYLSVSHDTAPAMSHGSWGSSIAYSPPGPSAAPGLAHSSPASEHTARYTAAAPATNKFPLSLITDGLHSSVGSVAGSDMDYMSPLSQSYHQHRDDVYSPGLMYDGYSTHQESPVPQTPPSAMLPLDHNQPRTAPPTSCPGLVYSAAAPTSVSDHHHTAHFDLFEPQHMGHQHQKSMLRECNTLGEHHQLLPSLAYTF